ncbi:MAG: hypothetical protein Q4G24_05705 [Paracoccus sp. (in: a-proteobacteria)]|uniref:hypothetical protein n=1 Tax=Paracoccus sp. TaxID=267 RepID=UPI0026E00AC7|nr:hypothetical protein [Paracoccus sp. (in: a-proteobacteria)]MDO5620948.1 hypothetical protein [Paracoccus sp. (in: a-proteobacteria)]
MQPFASALLPIKIPSVQRPSASATGAISRSVAFWSRFALTSGFAGQPGLDSGFPCGWAACHKLDIAAVAERLISQQHPPHIRAAWIFLVEQHDLDKISDSFPLAALGRKGGIGK